LSSDVADYCLRLTSCCGDARFQIAESVLCASIRGNPDQLKVPTKAPLERGYGSIPSWQVLARDLDAIDPAHDLR